MISAHFDFVEAVHALTPIHSDAWDVTRTPGVTAADVFMWSVRTRRSNQNWVGTGLLAPDAHEYMAGIGMRITPNDSTTVYVAPIDMRTRGKT